MKILCYHHQQDQRFEALVSSLSDTDHEVGHAFGEIDNDAVLGYNPDIIIHNIPNVDKFPVQKRSFISININDLDMPNCFSFTKEDHKNFIPPFVILRDIDVDPKDKKKYKSDIVYFGSPLVFDKLLECILNNGFLHFKFFDHKIHNISGYCGVCDSSEYFKYYRNAGACIVKKGDTNRTRDIVVCGGNPVVYDGSNHEECRDKILDALNNGSKFNLDNFDKYEILKNSTVFDRASSIFNTIGLTKVSNDIIKVKNKKIGKFQ